MTAARLPRTATAAGLSEAERVREIARLLPLWPAEIADTSPGGRARLVAKLHQALKAERRRGQAGHWTYDLARHAALLAVWRRERAALAALGGPLASRRAPAVRPAPSRSIGGNNTPR